MLGPFDWYSAIEIGIAAVIVGIVVLISWWQRPPRLVLCVVQQKNPAVAARLPQNQRLHAIPQSPKSHASRLASVNTSFDQSSVDHETDPQIPER